MSTIAVDTAVDTEVNDAPMSNNDIQKLAMLEATIKGGLRIFWQVGEALAEIREKRFYRQHYSTFEEYCLKKWNFTDRHARRLMESAEVMEDVSTVLSTETPQLTGKHSTMPANTSHKTGPMGPVLNERQVRELGKLPRERRAIALEAAIKLAQNEKLTARHIESVVKAVQEHPKTSSPDGIAKHHTRHRPSETARLPLHDKPMNALQKRENDILEALNHIFLYRSYTKAGYATFKAYIDDFNERIMSSYQEFIAGNEEGDYKG